MGEKHKDLFAADRSGEKPEVKVPESDPGDHRKSLPSEVIL
jgi:hypothetical protein